MWTCRIIVPVVLCAVNLKFLIWTLLYYQSVYFKSFHFNRNYIINIFDCISLMIRVACANLNESKIEKRRSEMKIKANMKMIRTLFGCICYCNWLCEWRTKNAPNPRARILIEDGWHMFAYAFILKPFNAFIGDCIHTQILCIAYCNR